MCDADLSTPIDELKRFEVWMKDHDYDVVIGSREGTGAQRIKEPFYRHVVGRVFNLFVQIVALPGVKDSQCGFKLFRHDVAKNLFGNMIVYGDSATKHDKAFFGAFDVELLHMARIKGYSIKELQFSGYTLPRAGLTFCTTHIIWQKMSCRSV